MTSRERSEPDRHNEVEGQASEPLFELPLIADSKELTGVLETTATFGETVEEELEVFTTADEFGEEL